ncbi:hypothetical protein NHF48_003305 [Sphingomonas sp. H160509]|uniref:hypothetical protein n=1 Tax=Sphingomonas sp. H160509 TaxID=2955313 RepID=UPI002097AB38|nr:hypothetical protein [Sphingomonas sp. H160509]MDD1450221.1 hypothetical protein [Sphingomonas sp. H160509]
MIEANTTLFARGDLAFTSSHDRRSLPHRQLGYSYHMIGGGGIYRLKSNADRGSACDCMIALTGQLVLTANDLFM